MRIQLLIWLILLLLGAAIGDRYGLPGWARGLTDRGFSSIEGWFGRLDEPIPAAPENEAIAPPTEDDVAEPGDAPPATAPEPAPNDLGNAANAGLRINDAGLTIIKESEGLRLEAYNAGGQWLIGYGHSRTAEAGMTITESEAEQLLREDVQVSEDIVKKMVLVPVNENQFSALVSFAYNLGAGAFSRSTVLDALNAGDYTQAADNFRNHNTGGGEVIEHLVERREKERSLFLAPT